MTPEDFHYDRLSNRLEPKVSAGWAEAEAFLLWCLTNVFRLDETAAEDAICDGFDDKGVDAIYVDDDQEIVYIFQSKLNQNSVKTIGDTDLKEFSGTLSQFSSREAIETMVDAGVRAELARVISDGDVVNKVGAGYSVMGVYFTNREADDNAKRYVKLASDVTLYDRIKLAQSVIDVDFDRSIDSSYSFDVSYAGALELTSGGDVRVLISAISATELVGLEGISDGTLFQRNVRLSLGSTAVNKEITGTVRDKAEHDRFILYHNGITLLCKTAALTSDGERLKIDGYSVVNGAQSLTTLYQNARHISSDLRVLVKFIELNDEALADRITWNSNNQNAIKYRDQRSNDAVQRRLQKEFEGIPDIALEIKRGERVSGKDVLSNEEAGLLILSFDLQEPWVCHQKYKVFDERYSEIFCRPQVTADYIALIHRLMALVSARMADIENDRIKRYTLTRYFLLYCLREALELSPVWARLRNDPSYLSGQGRWAKFVSKVDEVLIGLISDLNGEIEDAEESFDHKDVFKSPLKSKKLARDIVDVYKKEIRRGKVKAIDI